MKAEGFWPKRLAKFFDKRFVLKFLYKSESYTFEITLSITYFFTLTTSISPDLAASSSCFSTSEPVEGGSSVMQRPKML